MATKAIVRYRNRPKAKHRSKPGFTVPVAVLAGFAPMAYETYSNYQKNGLDGASQAIVALTTGYSRWEGAWKLQYLLKGMGPVVLGMFIHKMAGRLGLNRTLARAGVPFLRI
jgi:hypothetical protein